jgi:CheY-like chemotaxis protein
MHIDQSRGPVVMVVDDDDEIRDALGSLLELEGYEVMSASNGREALELLEAKKPDVILLDLMMPVMDGWTFRASQKSDPRFADVPVVVLTAAGVQAANRVDANHVLQKPLSFDRITRAIEDVTSRAA